MNTPDDVVGSPRADSTAAELFSLVYDQLRAIAATCLRRERPGHTLQPTAVAHEVYLRLSEQHRAAWTSPEHFLAVAAVAVRRVLIDHARGRLAGRRGPGWRRVPLTEETPAVEGWTQWLWLDSALHCLALLDARQARVVELKIFGGMTNDQVASALRVSRATVANDWLAARAWLSKEVEGS